MLEGHIGRVARHLDSAGREDVAAAPERSREIDADIVATGNLKVTHPYVAAVDPLGGRKEEPAAMKRARPRGKMAEERESAAATDRSLGGILTEALGEAAVAARDRSPH